MGPPTSGGNGADNFPGMGSVYGSILPGFALADDLRQPGRTCPASMLRLRAYSRPHRHISGCTVHQPPYGESSFNTFTVGGKWRFTGVDNPIGLGLVGYYKLLC